MDAKSFLDKHGKTVCERVAIRAGTNYAYFSQIAYRHRKPSAILARDLVAASAKEFADERDQLDFESLLLPAPRNIGPATEQEAA